MLRWIMELPTKLAVGPVGPRDVVRCPTGS
jgi:hypothetical protein